MLKTMSIGRKMLLQTGGALALAAGLLANQIMLSSATRTALDDIQRANGVYGAALLADTTIRQSLVASRDILLSRTTSSVEAAIAQIGGLRQEGIARLDQAIATAIVPQNKSRLEQARRLLPEYLDTVSELGALQRGKLDDEASQIALAADWDRHLAALLATPALATLLRRQDVEAGLERADALVRGARNVMWRYEATQQGDLVPQIGENIAEAEQVLARLKGMVADSALREPTAALAAILPRLNGAMAKLTGASERLGVLFDGTATPLRKRIVELIEPTKATARQKAGNVAETMEDRLANTTLLGLTLTVLLGIVLIAGAVIAMLSIARPIARVTDVLTALVKGERSVDIPYQDNGDEIGSLARAADAFKTTLVDVEKLEGKQRHLTQQQVESAQQIVAVVAAVSEVAQRTTRGDFSGVLDPSIAQGDLQKLVTSMNAINKTMGSVIAQMSSSLERIADGDLTATVNTHYEGQFSVLKNAINGTVAQLAETIRTIQETAGEASSAAREISLGAGDLSKRTEEQASSLEETAATTEELAASVKSSAEGAREAAEMAKEAAGVAKKGGEIVGLAVEAMGRIEEASRKISAITTVIGDIAFQTNLLALNAAVEAARAGEAGKGFAVVASEVRTLAQRSSHAAKDISGLIAMAVEQVDGGVGLVREAGAILNGIMAASHKVDTTINVVASASVEQANGINEMSQTVAQMDEITQQNAALAEESAAASSSLTSTIARLNELVSAFRIEHGAMIGQGTNERPAHAPPAPKLVANSRNGWAVF